jgi:hypothetical protein
MGMGRAAERIETLNARPSLAAALAARQQSYSAKMRRGGLPAFNDLPIKDSERKYHWLLGRRPDDHPSLSNLGL